MNDAAPMTWLDIARRLASETSRASARQINLVRARVGWFGVLVESTQKIEEKALGEWLGLIFPGRVHLSPLRIQLEGPAHADALTVELQVIESEDKSPPSFGVVDGLIDFQGANSPQVERPIPIVAALSVKGGTGRTTCAISLATRWASKAARPVLLVDADIEAPGISYLLNSEIAEAKIALEDVIALAHAEDHVDSPDTIRFAVERLRDHAVAGNIIIMPLRRDLGELASSGVRPEHLSTPERPYALADLLVKIAVELECAGVVVDVRAGLVPLSANLAMDPDVSPLFVTTLSDQAIQGTAAFIRFLSREMRGEGNNLKKPLLVVNRVPHIYRQSGMDRKLIEPLSSEMLSCLISEWSGKVQSSEGIFDVSTGLEPFTQVEAPEFPDLQVATAGWSTFLQQLHVSGFNSSVSASIDRWIETELGQPQLPNKNPLATPPSPAGITNSRKLLAEFAEKLVSAESAPAPITKPLVTRPLASLAQRFQSEVPIAVSEGAKGTGKTLAARYFIAQKTWNLAVSELIGGKSSVAAAIVPVCASIQSSSGYQTQVDSARQEAATSLQFSFPQMAADTVGFLKTRMGHEMTEKEWANTWLDVAAWSTGFEVDKTGAGERFLHALRQKNRSVVLIFEGLEELYASVDSANIQTAMRAALVALPQRLRSEIRRPLGVIIFARRDTVAASISQNLDQYRREYAAFALRWTEDDVLELAAWLATKSGAITHLWSEEFSDVEFDEKARQLELLWGRKLGPDDTEGRRIREAYTAMWIIAVLSDLQGRLVPRDLVRLLSNSAKISISTEEASTYGGRILIPRALKRAIEPTSERKVAETEEEIVELRPIFSKFKALADKISAPLEQDALDALQISASELETLKRHGIILGDSGPYEVPELFRRGLRLTHAGARRSVVSLYRRSRQSWGS